MAVSHAAGSGGLAGVGARIVPWRQLAIGMVNVSDRLTAPPARARHLRSSARSVGVAQHGRGAPGGWPRPSRVVQDPDAGAHEPRGVGARVSLRRRRPAAYPPRRFGANGAGEGGRELGHSGPTAGGFRRLHGGDGRVAFIEVRSAPRTAYPAAARPVGLLASMATGRHLGGPVAHKVLGAVLPMSLTTLKALTWDLVCFAVPTSQVELV